MGPHLVFSYEKNIETQRLQVGQFSPLDNNVARELDSGISYQGIESQNTV